MYVTTNIFREICDKVSQENTPSNIIPYLLFDYVITSHQFNSTHYFTKEYSDDIYKTQDKVSELHSKGWKVKKIHDYLLKNGYQIGETYQSVISVIKRTKKRTDYFNQPILDGIGNFRIKMLEII